jgi:hypothetical protein
VQLVQYLLTLTESTQNQHTFFPDSIEYVSDFLVVEQQVDELRDLDIVDCHTATEPGGEHRLVGEGILR